VFVCERETYEYTEGNVQCSVQCPFKFKERDDNLAILLVACVDGVMKDVERLGVRNWRIKVRDRDVWRRLLESAKTLHGL
jgi:hypothetical protein